MAKSEKVLLYCVRNSTRFIQSFVVLFLKGASKANVKGRFFGFWGWLAVFLASLVSEMAQSGVNQEKQGDGL